MSLAIHWAERGYVPDYLIKYGIRQLLRQRIKQMEGERSLNEDLTATFSEKLKKQPIAIHTHMANQQHYEIPAEFFTNVLGRRLKYSCCYFPAHVETLDEAEEEMLKLYAKRAGLEDGMRILDLGCGWGSLSLWLAEAFPHSQIVALSNSSLQKKYILKQAKELGLNNIEVLTRDINKFRGVKDKFDRILSIEMLEHVRNYESLFARIADWLQPDGSFFAHIFSHKKNPYEFSTENDDDWMGRYFFTGGIMPSRSLFYHFNQHMSVAEEWSVNGSHYEKTALAWLKNLDRNVEAIREIFSYSYGKEDADLWVQRWRIFFLSCAELFSYDEGYEWGVFHYRFEKSKAGSSLH